MIIYLWTAWELLFLVNQIYLWAITDFRTFVVEHLQPWHTFCDENYLVDWKSVYDVEYQRKRKRNTTDLRLPGWVDNVSEPLRQRRQFQTKKLLEYTLRRDRIKTGKARAREDDEDKRTIYLCRHGECSQTLNSKPMSHSEVLRHLQLHHDMPEEELKLEKTAMEEFQARSRYEQDDDDDNDFSPKRRRFD